ncbi:MAG: Uma2 family endonuclease [Saprospiraceae bacterium]
MDNQNQETNRYYTFEEYQTMLEDAEHKYEYHDGHLVEMAGGTGSHSIICNNIGTELSLGIRQSKAKCVTFNSDMNVWIPKCKKGLFPDASVVCGQPKYTTERQTVLENPMLIIEVLSQSTKAKDKGEKFECYRSLPSFQEYVLVYQTIPRIETWYKEAENLWRISSAHGLDKSIYLHSLDLTISLNDIYTNIDNLNLDENVGILQVY